MKKLNLFLALFSFQQKAAALYMKNIYIAKLDEKKFLLGTS